MYVPFYFFSEILQIIPFGPEPQKLFSTSGCKRINAIVTTELNVV